MAELSHNLIVFLVLLGACVAIGMAYGMSKYCIKPDDEIEAFEAPDAQKEYMREVRMRSQRWLWLDARAARSSGRGKMGEREDGGGGW